MPPAFLKQICFGEIRLRGHVIPQSHGRCINFLLARALTALNHPAPPGHVLQCLLPLSQAPSTVAHPDLPRESHEIRGCFAGLLDETQDQTNFLALLSQTDQMACSGPTHHCLSRPVLPAKSWEDTTLPHMYCLDMAIIEPQ